MTLSFPPLDSPKVRAIADKVKEFSQHVEDVNKEFSNKLTRILHGFLVAYAEEASKAADFATLFRDTLAAIDPAYVVFAPC